MSSRKCIFTGEESDTKRIMLLSEHKGEEKYNWTNHIPTTIEYADKKGERLPTDLEMEIWETFYLLEMSKLKAKFLENKLKSLQEKNVALQPKSNTRTQKKEKKQALHEKKVIQEADENLDKVLKKRSEKIWD